MDRVEKARMDDIPPFLPNQLDGTPPASTGGGRPSPLLDNLRLFPSYPHESGMALCVDVRASLSAAAGPRRQRPPLFGFRTGELMGAVMNLNGRSHIKELRCRRPLRLYMAAALQQQQQQQQQLIRGVKDVDTQDARTVMAVVLGSGAGKRLFPLTQRRAKPAVPIGGAYRLIDVPMSNCINSGINKVYILTQFNSASLNRHISRSYNLGHGVGLGDGFVEVLAATQTSGASGKQWFQGTADAVRQFHWLFEDAKTKDIEDILILSGDQLYRMDYMDLIQNHRETGADITISSLLIDSSHSSEYGLMKIDNSGRVISYNEKPKGEDLKEMEVDATMLGFSSQQADKKPYVASMGIYVFKKEILLNILRWRFPTANDFGSEVIPASAKEFFIKAYLFNDYWQDIGTIRSFFEANLALTEDPPRFSFYDAAKPIYTSRRNLPPSKVDNSKIVDSIVSHGSFLEGCHVEHSVVGIRSRISRAVHLKDTVMLGADYYETDAEIASLLAEGRVPVGIGENTKIRNCIIDKNARIGKNVTITNSEKVQEADRSAEGFYIRSGIIVVLKNSTIVDNLVI